MRNIILVGAGQIGSRHLQALALAQQHLQITVVDPSQRSLDLAKSRLEEIPDRKIQVSFINNVPNGKVFDLAIIATSAMDRFDVFLGLIESNKVSFIIFEKVLFQTIEHIERTELLLKRYRIHAWVNCARRSNSQYRKLQQLLDMSLPISMSVRGNNYGLACNGIHFLDLFAFLINQPDIDALEQEFENEYVETKRSGCYEVFGSLTAISGENKLDIHCSKDDDRVTVNVEILTSNRRFIIDEVNQQMTELTLANKRVDQTAFTLQPQSRMTHIVVEAILSTGQCTLPTYGESASLHRHYLQVFGEYFNNTSPGEFSACPIS
jgi:predicted dehydrogenase